MKMKMQNRRDFLKTAALSTSALLLPCCLQSAQQAAGKKPNIVFVFADQWRAQATGYSGDPNLQGRKNEALDIYRKSVENENLPMQDRYQFEAKLRSIQKAQPTRQ